MLCAVCRASANTASQDFDTLKKQVRTREFKPVPLGLEAICAVPPSA